MADSCPTIIGDAAVGLVVEGWDTFSGYASTSFNLAQTSLTKLYNFTLTPIAFDVSWNLSPDIEGYNRPVAPADITVSYNKDAVNDPGAPPISTIAPVTFTTAPTAVLVEPSINIDAGPSDLTAVAPGAAPTLAPVVIPVAPSITLPDAPTLYSLNLPTAPNITLPTFDGVRPVQNFDVPAQNWSFVAEAYSSTELDAVRAQIAFGLTGNTGLPLAIENALFDRALARDDVSMLRAQQEAREQRSSMGWSEPDGILDYRLMQVQQASINARANLSRDIYIQVSQVAIENIKFYTTQGIALESKLMDQNIALQTLILDSQKFVLQSAIEIFNGRISLFNAQQQAYATDAQVYRDKLQGALTEIEIYKAEIDAQRLVGEINQQLVSIYETKIRAVLASVEIYKAQVEGATAQAEANRVVIEAYRATVQAYAENVRAYAAQWDAFKSKVDAQVAKERIYEISANVYATRVDAWAKGNNNVIEQQKLLISEKDLDLRSWLGKIDQFKAEIEAEKARIDASVAIYNARVDLYRGEAQVETAASESNNRATQLLIENNKSATDVALKNAQLQVEQLEKNASLILEQLKGIATTTAQLCAASFSAVHFSAQASHSASNGQECSTVFQVNQ